MSFTVGRGGVAVAVAFALSVASASMAVAQFNSAPSGGAAASSTPTTPTTSTTGSGAAAASGGPASSTPAASAVSGSNQPALYVGPYRGPASVNVSGMSKAEVLAQASAPLPANLTDEQMVEAVKARVEMLAQAVSLGIISATELSEGVRDLVLVNRAIAGAVVTALVTVGQQGVDGAAPANLTVALGAGVGLAASELQNTVSSSGSGGISTSDTSAIQALESISTALTDTGAISGAFGSSYTTALNQTGIQLIPQATVTNSGSDVGASDPNTTIIPATPQTPTNSTSPS